MKKEIGEILKSKDLREITHEMVEKVLDNQISDKVLQEIPILKSLVAINNIYSSYTDKIFIKKAMKVLFEVGDVDWNQRTELSTELSDGDESGAEKILMAINHLETTQKCKVYGRLYRLKALGKIKYTEDFLRMTKLIQTSYLDDLILITEFNKNQEFKYSEDYHYPLINLGLIYESRSEPKPMRTNDERYDEIEVEFIGGDIEYTYHLTDLGEILLEHYYELFPEDKK